MNNSVQNISLNRTITYALTFPPLRLLLIILLALLSLHSIMLGIESLGPELVYRKDIVQDFLSGKALSDSLNPYQSVSELADIYLPQTNSLRFPYPNPHTPLTVGTVSLLIRFLDSYQIVASLWLFCELFFVVATVALLCYELKIVNRTTAIVLCLFCISARPIQLSFIFGQFGAVLLFLSAVFIVAIKNKKSLLAGSTLGLMLALKFFGVPVAIYLLLQKRWKMVFSASLVFIGLTGLSSLTIGIDTATNYYTNVLPEVSAIYRSHERNQSIWTLGQRLFGGLHSSVLKSVNAPPLFYAPHLIAPTSLILVILSLGYFIYQSKSLSTDWIAVSSLLAYSCIFSPLAWAHGLAPIFVGFLVCFRMLVRSHSPTPATWWFVLLSLLWFSGDIAREYVIGVTENVDFIGSLITLLPMITALLWAYFILHLGRQWNDIV